MRLEHKVILYATVVTGVVGTAYLLSRRREDAMVGEHLMNEGLPHQHYPPSDPRPTHRPNREVPYHLLRT